MEKFSEDVKKQVREIIDKYNESVKNGTATEGLGQVLERIEKITGPLIDKDLIPEDLDRFLTKEEIDNIFANNTFEQEKVEADELNTQIDDKIMGIEEKRQGDINSLDELSAIIDEKLKKLED